MRIYIESLGCARNQVDSEQMAGRLENSGATMTDIPSEADIIAVNTCSFIQPAVDESIDTILALARYKETGRCRRLIVAGCLPERYGTAIAEALPEVDVFLGTGAFDRIVEAALAEDPADTCLLPDPGRTAPETEPIDRRRSTPHMAYVKIAEGCSRQCTYCIIPKLRGPRRSRSVASIEAEVRRLVGSGVREIVLVAQDTTDYGRDLARPTGLNTLLDRLAGAAAESADGDPAWIRFLYGHPESLTDSVIATVGRHPNICPYFDIPIQHASNRMLKRMGRRYTRDHLHRVFDRIRTRLPEAVLRTTVLVGFPGETDADVDQLQRFVEEIRFDHLGVFLYSDASDLPSHALDGHVSPETAAARRDALMARQVRISEAINDRYLGRTVRVLVEDHPETGLYFGRTPFQAPEVDGMTYIRAEKLALGAFADVMITDAYEYDLVGEPA